MRLNNTTPVPNAFFDAHLEGLSGSAVRVYLKIVRNLLGWRDENGNVKKRDWIAHSQFEKTGLSNRSVTSGVQELLDHGLIGVSDDYLNNLNDPFKRKKAKRVYYSLVLENTPTTENSTFYSEKNTLYNAKTDEKPTQDLRITKDISLQKYNVNERVPDYIRIEQIRREKLKKQEMDKQKERDSWL
ncbi:hypothetical protein [Flavobacterium sp.]|uniref:hypothetical protein n=1 Tax=Flavobacterium sp. TaxID=239 RepID=UPI003F697DB3